MPHHRLSHPFPLRKTNKQQKSKVKKREEMKQKYDGVLTIAAWFILLQHLKWSNQGGFSDVEQIAHDFLE